MKIKAIRLSLLLASALAVMAVSASAQQQPDFSKVQIKTTKITNNFYTLEGQGGTIGVLAGPDGVFMVDGQFAPLTDKIVAAIKQISDRPIRFLVNTHVHGDHTGGNANFGKMGVTILARPELRDRLRRPAPGANPSTSAPPEALPLITYNDRIVVHMNGENVQLIPIRRAHTDGDTMVRFPANDVIMTGDFYRSVGFPNIDRINGGSLNGMINGLGEIIGLAGPNTKIIPGHGAIVDRNAVIAHRDMIMDLRNRVSKMIRDGKSEQEIVAAKPLADYESKVKDAGTSGERFVGQLYAELKGQQAPARP